MLPFLAMGWLSLPVVVTFLAVWVILLAGAVGYLYWRGPEAPQRLETPRSLWADPTVRHDPVPSQLHLRRRLPARPERRCAHCGQRLDPDMPRQADGRVLCRICKQARPGDGAVA
jgi:hypothetical protein